MSINSPHPENIDQYIAGFSPEIQAILEQIRQTIRRIVPDAQEAVKYGLATFTYHGNLVHFGAFKNHIGFYPTPSGIEKFKDDLAKYKGAKGSIQFPLSQPIPFELISRIVAFRVKENEAKARSKTKKN